MKRILSLVLVLILSFSLCLSVFAEGGDGSGGGSNIPLGLESSSVPDGSTDVPVDEDIILNFNKNVVNFTVKENNMTCFSMKDSKGNSVPITVIMGDDQVDRDIRRIITIHPTSLSEGETYTLTISGKLQAKNGTTLGDDITLTFSTVKPAVTATPSPTTTPTSTVTPSSSAKSQVTASPSASPSASSKTGGKNNSDNERKAATGKAVEKEKGKQSSSLVVDDFTSDYEDSLDSSRTHNQPIAIYIILGVILAAVIFYAIVTRNKNKQKIKSKEDENE